MSRLFPIALALTALFLSACGLSEADVQGTVGVAELNAVNTVHAQYTQNALLTPSATNTLAPTLTPAFTNTPLVTMTPGTGGGTSGCDVMTFIADVTVTDGEEIAAGTPFTKTWQVRNDGTCDWTTAYVLVYASGEQMSGPTSQPLAAAIVVGATGEISVNLTAPSTPGDYTGWWSIGNASGTLFGPLSVVIKVP